MPDPSPPHARSFGTAADRYDRYRPGYPADAVRWALGEGTRRVVDAGAGTGILSRALQRLGHEVVAVEPDDLMRARLADASPGITALAGTAEELPLPAGSVDAVLAGQAYHWFDATAAHAEFARVLRPGGVFAAMWNDADPRMPWTVRFAEIVDGARPASWPEWSFGERFGLVAVAEFRHELWLTPDDLVGLATTRSPYLTGTARERRELVAAVRRLISDEVERDGRDQFAMPHLTRVHRATLR